MVAPTRRRQRRAANATPGRLGALPSSPCDGPYRWTTPAPPTPALAVGRNAFALASPEDSARLKLRLHAAPVTCTLASHLSHLLEHSRRGRRSVSLCLPYSTSYPTRDTMKMFWPAHPNQSDCPRRFRRTYFAMTARPETISRWLRVTHLQLGTTRLPALDLPRYLAEVATHGPHQPNAQADQLAAQLQTVTLDGPAGAGANEAVPVAAPVAGPMDV